MAGKPSIEYAGAVYHVMNRGDSGGRIFKTSSTTVSTYIKSVKPAQSGRLALLRKQLEKASD
jgi:hypothetical protein